MAVAISGFVIETLGVFIATPVPEMLADELSPTLVKLDGTEMGVKSVARFELVGIMLLGVVVAAPVADRLAVSWLVPEKLMLSVSKELDCELASEVSGLLDGELVVPKPVDEVTCEVPLGWVMELVTPSDPELAPVEILPDPLKD